MKKRLVTSDPLSGKETWAHFNEDGKIIYESKQNVDAMLSRNREERNSYRQDSLIGNTQKHHQKVAEIPSALYHQLIKELGEPKHNPKAWKKWLNDYDNRFFRTGGGNV
jgi:hypothetical protein|tara:strand:+ start:224 stop:550 length:327 start_codon:yes stop_codon:yes gene_type:complete